MRILFLILVILQAGFFANAQNPPRSKEELEIYLNNLKKQSDSLLNQEIGWRFGISSGVSFMEPESPFK